MKRDWLFGIMLIVIASGIGAVCWLLLLVLAVMFGA